MLPAFHQPAESLIADPVGVARFGSFMEAMKATILHPDAVRNIRALERRVMQHEQVPCPVIHRFGPGIYIREIHMPAGAFAIGARHLTEHYNIMLKGRVTVANDNGTTTELFAPMAFVGKPGQKVGYVHEDVVWQNVYATDETDIETLEAMFVDKGDVWEEDAAARRKPDLQAEIDQADYLRVLAEHGITQAQAWAESTHTNDLRPFPYGSYKVMVTDSPRHGRGLFATAPVEAGEVIAPARIAGRRTPAGRYTNHSARPNARFVLRQNGDLDLVATCPIAGMHGGRHGEEITIDYRHALELRSKQCRLPSPQPSHRSS